MLAPIANRLWRLAARRALRLYEAALDDPERAQRLVLRQLLTANADTVFGRAHHFNRIDSTESFRRHAPLTTWDDYAPLVARIRAGESNVLTRDPVTRLIPSSGSTAAAKLVPYTRGLRRQFTAAINPWIADLYHRQPDLMNGPAYWSITPVEPRDSTPSAVPIGFDEDSAYLGALLKPLVDATLAVPSDVRRVHDIARFHRRTLFHLLRARDLRLISVWHPSFLTLLLDAMEREWPRLLAMFARRLGSRLAELRSLAPTDYRRIWPRLGLISAWGDAHAALHLDALRLRMPGVAVQPKGLLATEAFVSIPFADRHPLAVRSHFFEFLDDDDNRPRFAHELQVEATYRVVVTTAGGLYRYRLEDRVQVTGHLGRTPCLRFLGKEDHVSDRFGEKLNEGFVAGVVRDLLSRHHIASSFAMLAPGDGRYVLYIESALPVPAADLDAALSANPHYAYCRSLGQLAPPSVVYLTHAAYAAYTARLVSRGQRLGNIKPTALSPLDDWETHFLPAIDHGQRTTDNPRP